MYKCSIRYAIVGSTVVMLLIGMISATLVSCKKSGQPARTESSAEPAKTEVVAESESSSETVPSEKIAIRILYAGLPNTDRTKEFVDFLGTHFQQVETTDYNTFTGEQAEGFDVAIVDYDGTDTRAPRLKLSRQYTRATVAIGAPGAFLCSGLSLKTGYL